MNYQRNFLFNTWLAKGSREGRINKRIPCIVLSIHLKGGRIYIISVGKIFRYKPVGHSSLIGAGAQPSPRLQPQVT